jgi:transposase-like protein
MGRRSNHTPTEKRDAVLAVLSKRKTISEVCRELSVSEQTFHRWRNAALEGMESALADKVDVNVREAELARRLAEAERTVGQLALENELLGKASRRLT